MGLPCKYQQISSLYPVYGNIRTNVVHFVVIGPTNVLLFNAPGPIPTYPNLEEYLAYSTCLVGPKFNILANGPLEALAGPYVWAKIITCRSNTIHSNFFQQKSRCLHLSDDDHHHFSPSLFASHLDNYFTSR